MSCPSSNGPVQGLVRPGVTKTLRLILLAESLSPILVHVGRQRGNGLEPYRSHAMIIARFIVTTLIGLMIARVAAADVGDPQIRTDHHWYPGELACSTFERLFHTQAELYRRVVGVEAKTDEERALAGWLWRNTHYWHGEEG